MPPLRFLHLHFDVSVFSFPPGLTPAFRLQPIHVVVTTKIQIRKTIRFKLLYFLQLPINIFMTIILKG